MPARRLAPRGGLRRCRGKPPRNAVLACSCIPAKEAGVWPAAFAVGARGATMRALLLIMDLSHIYGSES